MRTGRRADDRPARPRHRFQLFHVLQPHAGMTYARSDSSRLVQLAFAKVDLLCEPTEPTAVWRIFISWITHRVSLLINLIKYQDPTRVKLLGPVGSLFSWPFDHLDDEPSSAAEELAQVGVAKFPRTACTSLPPRIWPSKRMREREKPNGRRVFFLECRGETRTTPTPINNSKRMAEKLRGRRRLVFRQEWKGRKTCQTRGNGSMMDG